MIFSTGFAVTRWDTHKEYMSSFALIFQNLLHDLEDKLKKTMMTNAQLDNEKRTAVYQVDLLKDRLEEQDETLVEIQREYKDKCRVCGPQR